MRKRVLGQVLIVVTLLAGGASPGLTEEPARQASIVAGHASTVAHHLALRPQTALDFTKVSGEYCFNLDLPGGGHMVHYATDPTKTREDVIDFVNATPLLQAGVKVDALPRFPGRLGTMVPGQWYFLRAGEMEPHHGKPLPFPVLMKATDLK